MAYRERDYRGGGAGFGGVFLFLSGVACGLLIATKTGKETRAQLSEFLNRGREKGQELLGKGKDELSRQKEAMTSEGGKEPFYESGKYT